MLVIVDSNEFSTSPKTIEQLQNYFGEKTIVKGNIECDIRICLDNGEWLAIERKTPNDFLSSIGDGRLKEQIENMHIRNKYVAICITGKVLYGGNGFCKVDGENTNWKAVSVRGMIRAIQFSGTMLEWCPVAYYSQMVQEIYETCNSKTHMQGLQKHRTITFPPLDERIQILGQLPGVGIESASSLLEFAGMMDNCSDEFGYGSLASALCWITIMSQIDNNSRPKLWNGKKGAYKILTNRKLFGLESDEYLKIEKSKGVKNGDKETNEQE